MHPLETNAPKQDGWTLERIEKITDTVWLTMEKWNSLPSKRRHTTKDWRRFGYLENFGGWKKVRIT